MGNISSKEGAVESAKLVERIRQKYALLARTMDRRLRRQWAASEAMDLGWGGVQTVSLATGLDRHTILAGARELTRPPNSEDQTKTIPARVRTGRKRLVQTDPGLQAALDALLNPLTRKGETAPLLLQWTCQSTAKLARALQRQNHSVSDRTVASLLRAAGFSLQDNRKCNEGSSHAERDAQFACINAQAATFLTEGQPVVWLETKKNEIAGDGAAARFAAESLGRWWSEMGVKRFPNASKLFIAADIGGSNQIRNRLWKTALQDLSDSMKLPLQVCHYPPATTKWHKIEDRLFNFITKDSPGQPSVGRQVMVNVIARPANGIRPVDLHAPKFDCAWNYTVTPRL